jgi:GTP-binding protein EngB required for normal cell division
MWCEVFHKKSHQYCLLCRRGIGTVDEDFMDFMHDLGTIYQVVFTKADTVSESKLRENIAIAQEIGGRYERLVCIICVC